MLGYLIKKVRRQPKVVRNNVAFGVASLFTIAVFSVWAYHLPTRLSEMTQSDTTEEGVGIFSQLFNQLGDQVAAVKESLPTTASTTSEQSVASLMEDNSSAVAASSSATSTVQVTPAATSSSATSTEPARVVRIVTVPSATTSPAEATE